MSECLFQIHMLIIRQSINHSLMWQSLLTSSWRSHKYILLDLIFFSPYFQYRTQGMLCIMIYDMPVISFTWFIFLFENFSDMVVTKILLFGDNTLSDSFNTLILNSTIVYIISTKSDKTLVIRLWQKLSYLKITLLVILLIPSF